MDVRSADPQDASYAKVAACLETHRYAALVGASVGFTKMEGTTVNLKDKIAYSALQNCQSSMVAGNALNLLGNGIAIPKAVNAGAVMMLSLKGAQKDTAGNAIDSEWMPADTKALLVDEDSSQHVNNFLWAYIMSNFQHPGDWGGIHAGVKATLDPLIRANYKNKSGAAVGYLAGKLSQFRLAKA